MRAEVGLRRLPLGTGATVVAKTLPEEANGLLSIFSKDSPFQGGRAVLDGPPTKGAGLGEVADS